MTFNEAAIIVVGLFGGYWLIETVLNRSSSGHAGNEGDPVAGGSSDNVTTADDAATHRSDYDNYIAANWYSILGVTQEAPPEQIRTAYIQRLEECDPTKVGQLGQEFRELADFKARQLNDAYLCGLNKARTSE